MNAEQITLSKAAHSSVDAALQSSPAIVLRKAGCRNHFDITKQTDANRLEFFRLDPPYRKEIRTPARFEPSDFIDDADHNSLMNALAVGVLPKAHGVTRRAPTQIDRALQRASERGYVVPPAYVTDRPTSHSENEAWAAACELRSGGSHALWHRDAPEPKGVSAIVSSYVVPNFVDKHRVPYIVDQLWIIANRSHSSVRLLALEIDGEQHLETENRKRDQRRDAYLESLGYEVYHVAGWWSRVDPHRAIAEFLKAAGVLDRDAAMHGDFLDCIDQYVCVHCREKVARHDPESIRELVIYGERHIAHWGCFDAMDPEFHREEWKR